MNYYRDHGIDADSLWERIKDVIVKTCISAETFMVDMRAKIVAHRNNCFELYGFDILIDENLKPWYYYLILKIFKYLIHRQSLITIVFKIFKK